MAYLQTIFANNEIYHIINRGVEKRITFLGRRDYLRFIETIEYYRVKKPLRFSYKHRRLAQKRSIDKAIVEIICFCLMPNHFHLLVKQIQEGGITSFVSKLANSYTKYFNTKYKRVGPLFQGSFKAVRVENDEQLIHVSRYIHLNPIIDYLVRDLRRWTYSSYLEFLGINNGFCQREEILSHFSNAFDYEKFVLDQEGYAREIKNMERLLLDLEN